MSRAPVALLLIGALGALACGGAPGDGALLWWTTDGQEQSAWVEVDGALSPPRAGLFAAREGRLWALQRGQASVSLADCDCARPSLEAGEGEIPEACRRAEPVEVAELIELGGPGRLEVLGRPRPEPADGELGQGLRPMGQLGPWLLFEASASGYMCGAAHGNAGSELVVVDLRGPTLQPGLVAEEQRRAWIAAHGDQARRLLRQDPDRLLDNAENLELTAFSPRWGSDGRFELGLQMTAGACYACSDGVWGSYSVSTQVPAASLPPDLQVHATLPPLVQAARLRLGIPEGATWGWSPLPAAKLESLRARWRAGGGEGGPARP